MFIKANRVLALLFAFVLFISTGITPGRTQAGTTERVSVSTSGDLGNAPSYWTSISADGRYVAFMSSASNLVDGDTNGYQDVFVHDRQTGETERVSVSSNSEQSNNISCDTRFINCLSMSADGRFVAFSSDASNLVDGDTHGSTDVFVHDRQTGETVRVSVNSNGEQGNNSSDVPTISADGRYVAFESSASNLVDGDTNGFYRDIFVHDRQTGETTLVSVSSSGNQGDGSWEPTISADGRYVAFESSASNLVYGDTNGTADIFVHDRQTGETTLVSVNSNSEQGNEFSDLPSLSADGHYVAFRSYASNLVYGDTNGTADIFVHDRQTGETTLVSVSSSDEQENDGSWEPTISADGRYVAFESSASNLVDGDTNGYSDVFVHDRQTGETERVSVSSNGEQGNYGSWWSTISADGRYVAFESSASNLVDGETYYSNDVFVHDRFVEIPPPPPPPPPPLNTFDVTVILVQTPGVPPILGMPEHTIDYFQTQILAPLNEYVTKNTYETVNLVYNFKPVNGQFIDTGLTLCPNERLLSEEAIQHACGGSWCEGSDFVIVVHSGTSKMAEKMGISDYGLTNYDDKAGQQIDVSQPISPYIFVGETDPVGFWAHEIFHVLGTLLRDSPNISPHPLIGAFDLLGAGSYGGNPVGSNPTFISSITRQYLGLMNYEAYTKQTGMGIFEVGSLENSLLAQNIYKLNIDDTHCYVVEMRSKESGDEAIPLPPNVPSSLVLYYITDMNSNPPSSECGEISMGVINGNTDEKITVGLLHPSSSELKRSYSDWKNRVYFEAQTIDQANTQATIKIEPLINHLVKKVLGLVIYDWNAYSRVLFNFPPGLLLPPEQLLPELDLHLFTDDGKHIGINYENGIFENQVTDSDISGDQTFGPESIVVPESIPGFHFLVSNIRAAQFLSQYPELQETLGLTETFQIMAVGALPEGSPVQSDPTMSTVPIGGVIEVQVNTITNPDGSLSITLGTADVSINSLGFELDSYYAIGAIKNVDVYNGLREKLDNVETAILKGKNTKAINILTAFINQLNADNLVSPLMRHIIIEDAQTLIDSLTH